MTLMDFDGEKHVLLRLDAQELLWLHRTLAFTATLSDSVASAMATGVVPPPSAREVRFWASRCEMGADTFYAYRMPRRNHPVLHRRDPALGEPDAPHDA